MQARDGHHWNASEVVIAGSTFANGMYAAVVTDVIRRDD